ncbi:MAG: hypothetical protein ACR2PA_24620 [Hyphomicrobiaceae bacterium]
MSLLVYSRDPGGTDALTALLLALDNARRHACLERWYVAQRDHGLWALAKLPGLEKMRTAGIDVRHWPEACEPGRLLASRQTSAVLTSTSDIDDDTDVLLWQAARARGIPSAAALDSDLNLSVRFASRSGALVLPDVIACTTAKMADRVSASLGIPAERCPVVGDLHHDRMLEQSKTITQAQIASVRRQWSARTSDRVALFCSECGEEMRLAGRANDTKEHDAIAQVIGLISSGEPLGDMQISRLVIRPHPRDREGKYDRYTVASSSLVRVDSRTPAAIALASADLVVGIKSAMLDQASLFAKPVYAWRPNQLERYSCPR